MGHQGIGRWLADQGYIPARPLGVQLTICGAQLQGRRDGLPDPEVHPAACDVHRYHHREHVESLDLEIVKS